jgi:hypothetical protein
VAGQLTISSILLAVESVRDPGAALVAGPTFWFGDTVAVALSSLQGAEPLRCVWGLEEDQQVSIVGLGDGDKSNLPMHRLARTGRSMLSSGSMPFA